MQRRFLSRSRSALAAILVVLVSTMAAPTAWSEDTQPEPVGDTEDEMTVSAGRLVTFEYTLKDDDGNVIDTSEGGQPFVYTHGRREVVAGLEMQLAGMGVGESKSVTVKPEQGYGPVSEKAIVEMPIDKIPLEAREVGRQLQGTGSDGQPVYPVVREVRESVVLLDFNHPLAGKTLHFDVKVLSIEEPPEAAAEGEGAASEGSPQE